MAWDGKIPFLDGRPMVYVSRWEEKQPGFVWRDNDPFEDVLTFQYFSRGRSAARGVFSSKTLGCSVEMFLTDLASQIPKLEGGVLEGTFKFRKLGSNFGICIS